MHRGGASIQNHHGDGSPAPLPQRALSCYPVQITSPRTEIYRLNQTLKSNQLPAFVFSQRPKPSNSKDGFCFILQALAQEPFYSHLLPSSMFRNVQPKRRCRFPQKACSIMSYFLKQPQQTIPDLEVFLIPNRKLQFPIYIKKVTYKNTAS